MVFVTCFKARRECGLRNPRAVERTALPQPFASTTAALDFIETDGDHAGHAHELSR